MIFDPIRRPAHRLVFAAVLLLCLAAGIGYSLLDRRFLIQRAAEGLGCSPEGVAFVGRSGDETRTDWQVSGCGKSGTLHCVGQVRNCQFELSGAEGAAGSAAVDGGAAVPEGGAR